MGKLILIALNNVNGHLGWWEAWLMGSLEEVIEEKDNGEW